MTQARKKVLAAYYLTGGKTLPVELVVEGGWILYMRDGIIEDIITINDWEDRYFLVRERGVLTYNRKIYYKAVEFKMQLEELLR